MYPLQLTLKLWRFLPHVLSAFFAASIAFATMTPALADSSTLNQGTPMSTTPRVKLQTNHGDILIELDAEKSPESVANFLTYVKDGFYDGTIFHRVIKNFMIQGGGFDANMKQKKTRKAITNEANNGLKNNQYTVSMARTNEPHSATSQFFINVANNDFLNHTAPTPNGWGYTVFGTVIEGTEVADKIQDLKTDTKGLHQDVPVEDVVIEQATIVE